MELAHHRYQHQFLAAPLAREGGGGVAYGNGLVRRGPPLRSFDLSVGIVPEDEGWAERRGRRSRGGRRPLVPLRGEELAGLDKNQIEQLCSAATHIRPDALLIACMDEVSSSLRTSAKALQSRLGAEINVELLEFDADALEKNPILPA